MNVPDYAFGRLFGGHTMPFRFSPQGVVSIAPEDSVELRQKVEQAKAVAKYGEIALRPAGHPAYDILDYTINEVVGLIRYAEMLRHRFEDQPAVQDVAGVMDQMGNTVGAALISIRTQLLDGGMELGEPEFRDNGNMGLDDEGKVSLVE